MTHQEQVNIKLPKTPSYDSFEQTPSWATDKWRVLQEIETKERLLEQERKARQELQEIIAMIAHKFRGPLLNIQYNAEHKNQKKRTLKAVRTMTALLDISSIISTNAVQLREKISQDKQGDQTPMSVLAKSLAQAMPQVLTKHMDIIKQHYLNYAKKTAQIPSTATWEQLTDDYLEVLENLQTEWENRFMELVGESDDLTDILPWIQARFFPIQILGFEENPIRFERYGMTESVLIIVMTEMLLNAIKYYRATTNEPVIVRWEFQAEICRFSCENPTTQQESDSSKGSHKGHRFLNLIAQKLEGEFIHTLKPTRYTAELILPRYLLTDKRYWNPKL
jgi:signal transduction histidine kinase